VQKLSSEIYKKCETSKIIYIVRMTGCRVLELEKGVGSGADPEKREEERAQTNCGNYASKI